MLEVVTEVVICNDLVNVVSVWMTISLLTLVTYEFMSENNSFNFNRKMAT